MYYRAFSTSPLFPDKALISERLPSTDLWLIFFFLKYNVAVFTADKIFFDIFLQQKLKSKSICLEHKHHALVAAIDMYCATRDLKQRTVFSWLCVRIPVSRLFCWVTECISIAAET